VTNKRENFGCSQELLGHNSRGLEGEYAIEKTRVPGFTNTSETH
jgi:hypothetical protein